MQKSFLKMGLKYFNSIFDSFQEDGFRHQNETLPYGITAKPAPIRPQAQFIPERVDYFFVILVCLFISCTLTYIYNFNGSRQFTAQVTATFYNPSLQRTERPYNFETYIAPHLTSDIVINSIAETPEGQTLLKTLTPTWGQRLKNICVQWLKGTSFAVIQQASNSEIFANYLSFNDHGQDYFTIQISHPSSSIAKALLQRYLTSLKHHPATHYIGTKGSSYHIQNYILQESAITVAPAKGMTLQNFILACAIGCALALFILNYQTNQSLKEELLYLKSIKI